MTSLDINHNYIDPQSSIHIAYKSSHSPSSKKNTTQHTKKEACFKKS